MRILLTCAAVILGGLGLYWGLVVPMLTVQFSTLLYGVACLGAASLMTFLAVRQWRIEARSTSVQTEPKSM